MKDQHIKALEKNVSNKLYDLKTDEELTNIIYMKYFSSSAIVAGFNAKIPIKVW